MSIIIQELEASLDWELEYGRYGMAGEDQTRNFF